MDLSPAAGKILGMVMAYAVSALGLLLAYYNYRKRIVKAEKIFTNTARTVVVAVAVVALTGLILGAAAAGHDELTGWSAVRANLLGVVAPGAILLVSFLVSWALYRHFAGEKKGLRRYRP